MKKILLLILFVSLNYFLEAQIVIGEELVGNTFYDLQTNASINNRIQLNDDGTISVVWDYSPNAIQTTNPPYPSRSSGYNYFDGSIWMYPPPDTSRSAFPSLVVTPSGKEMMIGHNVIYNTSGLPTTSNKIQVKWRAQKGSGLWSITYPWGTQVPHSLPKACGGHSNENVYVIFQGVGSTIYQYPPSNIEGMYGPILFARSTDGGQTWTPAMSLPLIDSTHYIGFSGDSYSIDASGDSVAITYGNLFTDVGLLKSTDAGQTWTKYIIQLHPQPMYDPVTDSLSDINHDGIADTISSNGGDSKVLIDNNGMCHVWFSGFRYIDDIVGDSSFTPIYNTDALYYWNETMAQNNGYVLIASAQDLNGNGVLDVPVDTFVNCIHDLSWGNYGGGITQMPSAGIDPVGKIFLAFQSIREDADTTFYHEAHRHVYIMTISPPYNPSDWTFPEDLVPSIADGGDGENQEGVFSCITRRADTYAYVLYQRDNAPGYGLARLGTCNQVKNLGNSSDMILCKVDAASVSISKINDDLIVMQNYPNPSVGSTNISIRIKKQSAVRIEIYNLIGKKVYDSSYGMLSSGSHVIPINTNCLTSGVYTYSVFAAGQKVARKLIVF